MDYNMRSQLPLRFVLYHLSEMMELMIPRRERTQMTENCKTIIELIDWLDERYILRRPGDEGFGQAVEMERRKKGLVENV